MAQFAIRCHPLVPVAVDELERWLERQVNELRLEAPHGTIRLSRLTKGLTWASTGTKDPAYSDVLYVEELIAPEVINTMPEATLRAFADHGDFGRALSLDASAAEETIRRTEHAGIDLDSMTAQLEREGVRSFCDSYHDLLKCIEDKVARTVPTR